MIGDPYLSSFVRPETGGLTPPPHTIYDLKCPLYTPQSMIIMSTKQDPTDTRISHPVLVTTPTPQHGWSDSPISSLVQYRCPPKTEPGLTIITLPTSENKLRSTLNQRRVDSGQGLPRIPSYRLRTCLRVPTETGVEDSSLKTIGLSKFDLTVD